MKLKGEIFVMISAAGFAMMPIFAKLAYAGGASTATVLLFRFLFATIFIWVYMFIKKINFRISKNQILGIFILGSICYTGSALLLFSAYKYISAGFSEVCMFTYPAWVLILKRLFSKERIDKYKLFAIALSIIGIIVSTYDQGQVASIKGTLLALSGGAFYALYVTFIDNRLFYNLHPVTMTAYIIPSVAIINVLLGLINGGIGFNFAPLSWVYMMLLGFFSTCIALLAFCSGAKLIGSTKASIISTVEPLLSFGLGYMVLGEKFTWNMTIGGILIISAVLVISRNNQSPSKAA